MVDLEGLSSDELARLLADASEELARRQQVSAGSGRDVSSRALIPLLEEFQRRSLPLAPLERAAGATIHEMMKPDAWFSWDTYYDVVTAADPYLSDDDWRSVGSELFRSRAVKAIAAAAAAVTDELALIRFWAAQVVGSTGWMLRNVDMQVHVPADGIVEVVVSTRSPLQHMPRGFLLGAPAVLSQLPVLVGGQPAEHSLEVLAPHRARMTLYLKPNRSLAARLRRRARVTIDNVLGRSDPKAANTLLVQRNQELLQRVAEVEALQQRSAQLRSRLTQGERLETLGRMAGGVAHDFNNLLAILMCQVAVLRELGLGERAEGELAVIEQAMDRGTRLTGQLLAFARRQQLNPEPCDVGALVRDLSTLLQPLLGRQIRLEILVSDAPLIAFVDRSQIERVVLNLAINAREAMPETGTLVIHVRRERLKESPESGVALEPGPYVAIEVRDDGAGMDEATQSHIFEPFFTTKSESGGTGLGLATVHGIVRQHLGAITVDSSPTAGTTFVIYLPVTNQPARRDPTSRAQRAPVASD